MLLKCISFNDEKEKRENWIECQDFIERIKSSIELNHDLSLDFFCLEIKKDENGMVQMVVDFKDANKNNLQTSEKIDQECDHSDQEEGVSDPDQSSRTTRMHAENFTPTWTVAFNEEHQRSVNERIRQHISESGMTMSQLNSTGHVITHTLTTG